MSKLTPNIPKYKKHHPVFRRLMGGWSFLVWLAMIGVTYLCYTHGGSFLPLNGQVVVAKENVSSLATARLARIQVVQGQEVKRGDVIGQLDTTMIDLKIQELAAKLKRERQSEALEIMDRRRRLMTDAQDLRKTIYETEIKMEFDKSSRVALEERYKTLDGYIKKGLVSDAEYVKIGIDLAGLDSKLKQYPEIIAQYQRDLEDISRMRQELDAPVGAAGLDAKPRSEDSDLAEDPEMKQLMAEKEDCTLRAASEGSIGRINFQVGEIVSAGTAVVEIVKQVPAAIETFVPEQLTVFVAVGQEFYISTLTSPNQRYKARIETITPQVVGQLDKANSMTERVVRGRRLLLTLTEPNQLLPGESVMIQKVADSWF